LKTGKEYLIMKNIIVTDKVKAEVIKYIGLDGYENAEEGLYKFYYYCMINNIDLCDADRYANLNTIIGYDVGKDNFEDIDSYLWGEEDYDLNELTISEEDKQLIKKVVDILNLDVDFSKWRTEEPKSYIYYV
jgi:hypothetical protein